MKFVRYFLFLIALLLLPISFPLADTGASDSIDTKKPCSDPEFRQFDFWLSEWDLTWGEGDNAGTGTNIITAEMDGCVIEENFSSDDDRPFIGNSLSVYDKQAGLWKQTWVDNSGGYLDFEGEFKDGKMILSRRASRDGKEFLQRMVWYNIKDDSLDWNWERSDNDGEDWKILWQIHYQRKK